MNSSPQPYDVIVIGAGPAGTAAAIAAGRRGCRVLLLEQQGFCGGMATAGLVNPILGHYYRNPETGGDGSLIEGLLDELFARLDTRRARLRFRYTSAPSGVFSDAFDDAWLRVIYDRLLAEAGVETRYHTQLLEARCAGDRLQSVRVVCKAQLLEFAAGAFIDATGDADLAAQCGVGVQVGRDGDGLCQPCSTMFRMGGVDKERLLARGLQAARDEVNLRFQQARASGRLEFPFRDQLAFYEFPRPGVLHFNSTRMTGAPALTAGRLSELEIEGRRQAALLCDWLIADVPGFEHAFLESLAPRVGVRETRRTRGLYTMTRQNIVDGTRFPDGIARSAYFIDIHDPRGAGGLHADREVGGTVKAEFKPRRYYEVPLRALQNAQVENLLVACRALSADHHAHAAIRVMGTLTAVGEAAGVAAGLAREAGKPVAEINGADVRARLAYLDQPLSF
jgi:hypothetical protein